MSDFEAIKNKLFNELSESDFELIGIFSFLMGVDYTSQAYPNRETLSKVKERFLALNITDEMINTYFDIMNSINVENSKTLKEGESTIFDNIFGKALESMKDAYLAKIEVPNAKTVELKLIKSKLNKFLDIIEIPIGYATAIVEFKKHDLTYESLLKANDIVNNQGIYTGTCINKFTELYGDKFFMELLSKASSLFNNTKFALIYEESILSTLESINRFPLCIDAESYTDNDYQEMKDAYIKKQEELFNNVSKNKEEYQSPKMTKEQIHQLMETAPDEFVILNLLDNIKQNKFNSANEVVAAIDNLCEQTDFVEHMFTYIKKNQDNPHRCVGATGIENIDISEIVNAIDTIIALESDNYKNYAEENCAEIPSEQLNRIVTLVNDVIRGCVLKTQEHKQYLISQLYENGVTTWNHLQQIMTVIETCDIYGESATAYNNLYNYIQEKTNITEVFENAKKLNGLQIKLSVYHAFKNWFKFHNLNQEEKQAE